MVDLNNPREALLAPEDRQQQVQSNEQVNQDPLLSCEAKLCAVLLTVLQVSGIALCYTFQVQHEHLIAKAALGE